MVVTVNRRSDEIVRRCNQESYSQRPEIRATLLESAAEVLLRHLLCAKQAFMQIMAVNRERRIEHQAGIKAATESIRQTMSQRRVSKSTKKSAGTVQLQSTLELPWESAVWFCSDLWSSTKGVHAQQRRARKQHTTSRSSEIEATVRVKCQFAVMLSI